MGKNWAIAIGINEYQNMRKLKYAQRDAESICAFFRNDLKFERADLFAKGAPPVEYEDGPPINSAPTFGNLKNFFDVRFDRPFLSPGDNLWFFFAGHGKRHKGRDYLMPADSSPRLVESLGISISEIAERLRRSGADNVILMIDACRGEDDRDGGEGVGRQEQKGIITLFSCSPSQLSYELDDLKQGAFTHALIEGLKIQGAGNCATVERLDLHLKSMVPVLNRRYNKPEQNPYTRIEPVSKSHLILLPSQASLADVLAMKNDALEASAELDFDRAEYLWMRVLAVSPADAQAVKNLQRIAVLRASNPAPTPVSSEVSSSRDTEKVSEKTDVTNKSKNSNPREESTSPSSENTTQSLDLTVEVGLDPLDIQSGIQKVVNYEYGSVTVKIPAGLQPGQLLRLKGKGKSDSITQTTGDLYLRIVPLDVAATQTSAKGKKSQISFSVLRVNDRGSVIDRQNRQTQQALIELPGGVELALIQIPGGEFMMGKTDDENGDDDETPRHLVKLQSFWMGQYPITQFQWRAIATLPKVNIELNPDCSNFNGDQLPVERVSWYQAVESCDRLSRFLRCDYQLPTEAQWEYACRAGTTTPFHFGETVNTDIANYRGEYSYGKGEKGVYRKKTTPVGDFSANAYGLYDMHGNVWEWCLDHWHKNYGGWLSKAPTDGSAWLSKDETAMRLLRGGSWLNNPRLCRSAFRSRGEPDDQCNNFGFRVVCVSPRAF